jgi:hypothetical protein
MLTIVLSSNAQIPSDPKTTNTPTEQTKTKEKKKKKDKKGDKKHKDHKGHDDDRDDNREGKKDKKDRNDDNDDKDHKEEKGGKGHKGGHKHDGESAQKENGEGKKTMYACPMNCEKPSKTAGKCSKCGMDLVEMTKKGGRGKKKGDR